MGACARLGRAVAPLAGQWRRRRVTISPLEQCAYRQITGDAMTHSLRYLIQYCVQYQQDST